MLSIRPKPERIGFLRSPSQAALRALLASGDKLVLTNREKQIIARTPNNWDDIWVHQILDNKKRLAVYRRKRFRNRKYRELLLFDSCGHTDDGILEEVLSKV